jgi:hypothetical protein
MGPVVVAMPRSKYQGAFSAHSESPVSHLIGSGNSDDQLLAGQMASRLSQKHNIAVFCSCQLVEDVDSMSMGEQGWSMGMDRDLLSYRAAALAEKEIGRRIQERKAAAAAAQ